MSNCRKSAERFRLFHFPLWAIVCALSLSVSPMAHAFNFELGDSGVSGSLDTEITVGASVRTEERDPDLISTTNIHGYQNFCDGQFGTNPEPCGTYQGNLNFIAAPGAASSQAINSDNGDLNYDEWEFISAAAKIRSELELDWKRFGLTVSGLYFHDFINSNFDEYHPNNFTNHGFQPRYTPRSDEAEDVVGSQFILKKAYISGTLPFIGWRRMHFQIGNQILNQGRSKFLVFDSLNTINPPNANLLHLPGSELGEVFRPVPMVVMSTDLTRRISTKIFYQFLWRSAGIPPAGTYFSTADIAGAGARYGMLSFGRVREDPYKMVGGNPYSSPPTPSQLASDAADFSASSRTFTRLPDDQPSDQGQWGISLSYFAKELNYTMFSFYYRNLHSRLPLISFKAAEESCAHNASNAADVLSSCPGVLARKAKLLPVDTMNYFLEYPEDNHTFGLSFSTSLGFASWAGELAYRPNQPLQVNTTDLVYASLQPAFPKETIVITPSAVLPGNRVAIPDNIEHEFRNNSTIEPNQYIQGYVRRDTMNLNTSFIFIRGAQNPFGANAWRTIVEVGAYAVLNMPDEDAVQLGGPGTRFHHSFGKDFSGTPTPDQKALINYYESTGMSPLAAKKEAVSIVQNPSYQGHEFADAFSWGYRVISRLNYQDVFMGVDLLPEVGFFHDVTGTSPGPGRNYIQGRMRGILGLQFNYKNRWFGGVRHVWYFGGGINNKMHDRDYLTASLGYSF